LDERAAAFHALGYARATGKPAVAISTSGTAAANYYPAIVEAKKSQIPLIFLTADRPPELRDTGANQTIDQVNMFGNNLNWQFDFPCPDTQIPAKMVLTTIDQAVHMAANTPAGPVHLNCMFREPLEPSENSLPRNYSDSVSSWEKSSHPYTDYKRSIRSIKEVDLKDLANLINRAKKGWLVVGQLDTNREKEMITKLATKLHWPVFADVTSGIKNKTDIKMLVPYFDQILLSDRILAKLTPEVILHFGRPLTSKRYLKTIENLSTTDYIQFDSNDVRFDPAHLVSKSDQKFEQYLHNINANIDEIVIQHCLPEKPISEISVAHLVAQNISKSDGLFVASSMPIRDFDMYGGSAYKTNFISSNRGASGIDGTLASAVGYANGLKQPVIVVLGDLAMLHDLNSLSQVFKSKYPLTIILVNNGGGGIFSFLPVSEFEHVFDQYFATPHSYRFDQVCKMFGIVYENPHTNQELIKILKKRVGDNRSMMIEIITDRKENFILHQEIQKKIVTALEK
jgi:2-succinyl-5-enolpyruvyl-6-hydroxy-3-cyclohexene-1-carboxylate synthase